MSFEELALNRRSIRKFTGRKVGREIIDGILRVTMTAPSSKNTRSTRIVVSDDPAVAEVIADMRSTGTSFVKDAPLVFFIMGDAEVSDLWKENCSISATVLQFAAEDLGLGTCWVHVCDRPHRNEEPEGKTAEEFLRESLPSLPGYRILCVVACGYPETRPRPHGEKDDEDKIIFM